MKKLLFAVPFCFLLSACKKTVTVTNTVTETIDLKRGLIAYYPFNGNANDTSGNNKNGILMNGTGFSTDAQGKANSAANFDGVDDYINIPDATNYFAPPKLSISFLLNLRNTAARTMAISKTAFTTASGVVWSSGVNSAGKVALTIGDPTTSCSLLWVDNPADDLLAATSLQNNQWFHVVLIYNQGVELIYINGALSSAKIDDHSSLKQCSGSNVKIGGWWQNDIVSIQGKIDEVRIYNRVLAENEIEKLAEEIR